PRRPGDGRRGTRGSPQRTGGRADEHRVPAAAVPAGELRTGADPEPDPRPRVALRLRRRRQRARDLHQLSPAQGGSFRASASADRARRRVCPPRPEAMTQSLRGRLLIGVISLVVVGLLISDIATYAALQTF